MKAALAREGTLLYRYLIINNSLTIDAHNICPDIFQLQLSFWCLNVCHVPEIGDLKTEFFDQNFFFFGRSSNVRLGDALDGEFKFL